MKFKGLLEKKGPCACGKTVLKRGHDFIADLDTTTLHTRKNCRPLQRADIFGLPVQQAKSELENQRRDPIGPKQNG